MKMIFCTLIISILFLTACTKKDEHRDAVSNSEFCKVIDDLSKSIMLNRQAGIAMADSMQVANSIEDTQMKGLVQAIVNDAYTEPRYSVEENQEKAVTDFRNKMYHGCINRNDAD